MYNQEQIEAMWRAYDRAKAYLDNGGKGRTKAEGAMKGQREYAQACKALIRAGEMSPIKKKYLIGQVCYRR